MFLLTKVDARGMSCPQPVIIAKKTAEGNLGGFQILVDNNTAKENVMRFLKSAGFKVEVKNINEDYLLKASK